MQVTYGRANDLQFDSAPPSCKRQLRRSANLGAPVLGDLRLPLSTPAGAAEEEGEKAAELVQAKDVGWRGRRGGV